MAVFAQVSSPGHFINPLLVIMPGQHSAAFMETALAAEAGIAAHDDASFRPDLASSANVLPTSCKKVCIKGLDKSSIRAEWL